MCIPVCTSAVPLEYRMCHQLYWYWSYWTLWAAWHGIWESNSSPEFFVFCFLSFHFFFFLIEYFLYLHFKCYPLSLVPFPGNPLSHPTSPASMRVYLHPPTPTSPPSVLLHWGIYRDFIGPRTPQETAISGSFQHALLSVHNSVWVW